VKKNGMFIRISMADFGSPVYVSGGTRPLNGVGRRPKPKDDESRVSAQFASKKSTEEVRQPASKWLNDGNPRQNAQFEKPSRQKRLTARCCRRGEQVKIKGKTPSAGCRSSQCRETGGEGGKGGADTNTSWRDKIDSSSPRTAPGRGRKRRR